MKGVVAVRAINVNGRIYLDRNDVVALIREWERAVEEKGVLAGNTFELLADMVAATKG